MILNTKNTYDTTNNWIEGLYELKGLVRASIGNFFRFMRRSFNQLYIVSCTYILKTNCTMYTENALTQLYNVHLDTIKYVYIVETLNQP